MTDKKSKGTRKNAAARNRKTPSPSQGTPSRQRPEPMSAEYRAWIEKAKGEVGDRVVADLVAEGARKELAALRAERDGFVSELPLLGPVALSQEAEPLRFLIKGVWPVGSFGPFGGQKKTLKTWCAMLHSVALASGEDSFGYEPWAVPIPRPVLYLCGEGGERMVKRRLQRVAEMYDVKLSELPLYVVVGVAPFNSDVFHDQIGQHVNRITQEQKEPPGLIVLDSLYNYHPQDVEVTNLYGRGALLGGLSQWVRAVTGTEDEPDGAALWTVDHFNKSGSGLDLDRYGQAGMNAWADSWWNTEVGESVPESGHFVLNVEAGSRQGYHRAYQITVELGVIDGETGDYDSPMQVQVLPGGAAPGGRVTRVVSDDDIRNGLIYQLTTEPFAKTKRKAIDTVIEALGVGRPRVDQAWKALVRDGAICARKLPVSEGERTVRRTVWGPGSDSTRPSNPTGRKRGSR